MQEVLRYSSMAGTDLQRMRRYVKLPADRKGTVDTAAIIVVGRALGDHFRTRAQRLLLQVPDEDGPSSSGCTI